jgi:hypothetical protein
MKQAEKPPKDMNEVLQRDGWVEVRRQIDNNRYTLDEVLGAHPEIARKLAEEERVVPFPRAGQMLPA